MKPLRPEASKAAWHKITMFLIMGALLSILSACVLTIQPPTPVPATEPTTAPTTAAAVADNADDLQERYAASLQDAKIAEAAEVYDGLTAIVPENAALVWQAETGRVLMVTWTSWNGYDNEVGNEITLARDIWATAAPQLQTFCQSYVPTEETPVVLRMEQLLGLPPHNGKTRMVEFWADPAVMFRPSPDSEIEDTVAELELPGPEHFASQEAYEFHRDWFNLQVSLDDYDDPSKGYPWTRLGYTYDWGNPESEVGLSEFIIPATATVLVESVALTEAYCTP
ncbi:MAG: hypothetical protein KF832_08580 [Caldilineaceae bacterium]|nr:hypothetical protein [Caldilineaceae bacterium]